MSETMIPVFACTHCAFFVEARMTAEDEPLLSMLIKERWEGYEIRITRVYGPHERDGFSTRSCDLCGASNPGTRHDGVVWRI